MHNSTAILNALDATESGLRVVFRKAGDRWSHVVERLEGGNATVLLVSREGHAGDAWPTSPPFQEISVETLPDGRQVIFLVGKAGTSHWSASVEARQDPPLLVFDIACRHAQPPARLGSEYSQAAAGSFVARLQPLLVSTRVRLDEMNHGVTVQPMEVASTLPATARWKYSIE